MREPTFPSRVSTARVAAVVAVLGGAAMLANQPLEYSELQPAGYQSLQPMPHAYLADSDRSTYTAPSSYSVGPTQGPSGG